MKTKYIILGGLLAVISAILQCIPAFLSEAFIFLTVLSTIPIYIIAKKQPTLGILSYIIAFILIPGLRITATFSFLHSSPRALPTL